MQDGKLVKSLQARQTAALAALYDAYAKPLYGYCRLLLDDRIATEEAVRDTFLVAELRIDELGDHSRLKPWLFAIAREEALRQGREETPGRTAEGEAGGTDGRTETGPAGRRLHEMPRVHGTPTVVGPRSMAEAAVAALEHAEREALELAVRYGLGERDIAVLLDLSPRRARAFVADAGDHLRRALTAVILARTGRDDCRRLAALTGPDVQVDASWWRPVSRHARFCRRCRRRTSQRTSPAKVLTMLPSVDPPAYLRWRVLSSYTDPAQIGYRLYVARRIGTLDVEGFPQGMGRRRRPGWLRSAAAALFLLSLGGVLAGYPFIDPDGSGKDLSLGSPDNPGWPSPNSTYPWSPYDDVRPSHRPSPSALTLNVVPATAPTVFLDGPPVSPIVVASGQVGAQGGPSGGSPSSPGHRPSPTGGSGGPGGSPSGSPSPSPTDSPTSSPTSSPTASPTASPTSSSTDSPSSPPSSPPNSPPSEPPSEPPGGHPTREPSESPTRGGDESPDGTR
ncbi:MAG: hypothetical protein GEV03_21925 [Streptosporangiales bacterium]|nr:hypothetical protein [Streptosporangiales bacterium]